MAPRSKSAAAILAAAPPLPLERDHWLAVVKAMGISEQQAKVAELMLRDLSVREIAIVTSLGEGTVKDYQDRMWKRIGGSGKMRLAMKVLALALETYGDGHCHPKR